MVSHGMHTTRVATGGAAIHVRWLQGRRNTVLNHTLMHADPTSPETAPHRKLLAHSAYHLLHTEFTDALCGQPPGEVSTPADWGRHTAPVTTVVVELLTIEPDLPLRLVELLVLAVNGTDERVSSAAAALIDELATAFATGQTVCLEDRGAFDA